MLFSKTIHFRAIYPIDDLHAAFDYLLKTITYNEPPWQTSTLSKGKYVFILAVLYIFILLKGKLFLLLQCWSEIQLIWGIFHIQHILM